MIYQVAQQTPEWLSLRCGRITASRVKDVMDYTAKGMPSAKRTNYLYEVVSERMTGLASEHFVTNAMMWGAETEEEARRTYEAYTDNNVMRVGLATHPKIEMFAASPDGIINGDGIFECKCPMPQTHVKWIQGQVVPDEHTWQLYAEMACWELDWSDFMSFDPRPKSRYQRFIRRFERNDDYIAKMEMEVRKFLGEADAIMEELNRLCPEDQEEIIAANRPKPHPKPQEIDPELGITDADLPDWYHAMKERP